MTDDLVQKLKNYIKEMTKSGDALRRIGSGGHTLGDIACRAEATGYAYSLKRLKYHAPELFEEQP